MWPLCKYKNMFGEPNKGLRAKYRVLGVSLIDLVPTLIFAYIFAYLMDIPFWLSLVIIFIVMLFFHRIFCVRSTTDKLFFRDF